ncbi:hypothetical protein GY45DRAFT_1336527 [Cubamyces sp. BRFM 1775]|nr:hypothetical protein GY45DRAFT_1336527 [Cubamyces sp. BRFM 1775]
MATFSNAPQNPHTNSISSIFNPGFIVDGLIPNLEITSADAVHFHVHRDRLFLASTNAFGGLLRDPVFSFAVPEPATVLNIVLNVIYGMSCLPNPPSLESTEAALDALIKYGLPVAQLAKPSYPLYELIRSYAPYYPIEAYAVAGHYKLEELAVAISAHLLAFDLSRISDELTVKMGPIYFSRLANLHRARMTALRNIVLQPPAMHPITPTCNEEVQRELSRAWAFANAEIVWNALPSKSPRPLPLLHMCQRRTELMPMMAAFATDISTYALESAFTHAAASIKCPDCQMMLRTRIKEVIYQWSAVKLVHCMATIPLKTTI